MSQKVIDGILAAFNEGNLAGLDGVLDPNVVRRAPAALRSDASNREEFKHRVTEMRAAFPDCKVVITEVTFVEDRGFMLWTFTGTNTGTGDSPPTGQAVHVSGATHARFKDGKLIEETVFFDASEMLSQLSVIEIPS